MGYVYQPKLKKRPGETEARQSSVWWCKYYENGQPRRESTGTASRKAAERFLKQREGAVATGAPIMPRADRVRFEEAEQDLRKHYEATGTRNLNEYTYRVQHLTDVFAGRRIATIGQPDVDAYILRRQSEGAVGSTIRRELGTLTKLLRRAYENGKLIRLPILHKPKEGAPREGFFERDQYEAVRRHLKPEDLQVAAAVAYTF